MRNTLNETDRATIQEMRFKGYTNSQIQEHFPHVASKTLAIIAPTELRGNKRRLAEYVQEHPGVDFNDIPFWKDDIQGPTRVGGWLRDLNRAGLITFKVRPATPVNGHGVKGNSNEGFYDIRLTRYGQKRVEESRIASDIAARSSEVHAAIVEKVVDVPEPIIREPLTFDLTDEPEDEPVQDALSSIFGPEPEWPEPEPETQQEVSNDDFTTKYPILASLKRRQAAIKEVNALLEKATTLYDEAGLTQEAVMVLEAIRGTTVTFEPIEIELMSLAEALTERNASGIANSTPSTES